MGKKPKAALEFLILHLNTLQDDIEFQFLPNTEKSPFIESLGPKQILDFDEFKTDAREFMDNLEDHYELDRRDFELPEIKSNRVLIISLASLKNHFYHYGEHDYSIIFMGDWDIKMAPPSIIESILTLVIREAIDTIRQKTDLCHWETRGCINDFNFSLGDSRYKVMQGFICEDCRKIIREDIKEERLAKWIEILKKGWIGDLEDSKSPASLVAKLGYNLFATAGLKPTFKEKTISLLQESMVQQLVKIVGTIIIAALLLWLGLGKSKSSQSSHHPSEKTVMTRSIIDIKALGFFGFCHKPSNTLTLKRH